MLAFLPACLLLGSTNAHPLPKAQAGPAQIEITRGSLIPGLNLSDQDVEETVLDATEPDLAHGGFYTLDSGPTKTILVRFGQLKRYLAHVSGVAEAELVFTPDSDAKPVLKSAGRLLKPWGQGPALRLSDLIKPTTPATAENPTPSAPRTDSQIATWAAATWKDSRVGVAGARWQVAGARGAEDVEPITGAQVVMTDEGAVIKGLGPAVEAMLRGENDGFAFSFDSVGNFFSSANTFGKPILRIVPKAAVQGGPDLAVISIIEANGLHATVKNLGDQPAPAFTAVWSIDGTSGTPVDFAAGLAPGQTKVLDYSVPGRLDDKDHRRGAVTLAINVAGADSNWANNALTYFPKGIPVHLDVKAEDKAAVDDELKFLNEVVLPRSRYSAALDGCLERVRLVEASEPNALNVTVASGANPRQVLRSVLLAIGASDLGAGDTADFQASGFKGQLITRFADLTGGGDTRFDAGLLPSSSFPEANFFSPLELTTPAEPTFLLAPNSVFALNAAIGQTGNGRESALKAAYALKPSAAVALRASDGMGHPLGSQVLNLYKPGSAKPDLTLTTGEDGVVLLPSNFVLPVDASLLVSGTKNGVTEWDGLRGWQINTSGQRGAKVAFIDLRFALPSGTPDYGLNLATGRTLSDSANSLPATLAPLIDGQGNTDVPLPATQDGFIEIDLNRDRTITEIRLKAAIPWKKFDILVYNTGQKSSEATLWAREQDFSVTKLARGVKVAGEVYSVGYRGQVAQVRYIRIVNKETTASKGRTLQQLEIFGQQQPTQ